MTASANPYMRQVLDHTAPPPAIEARFFHASPVPIDDPLAPLPASSAGSSKLPPKPFAQHDNAALETAWRDLRRKLHVHREEQSEERKRKSEDRSRTRTGSLARRDGSTGSSPRPGTPRARGLRPAASNLSQVDGPETELSGSPDALDASALNPDAAVVQDTTGNPFVRAPSRKKVATLSRSDDKTTSRPRLRQHDTYEWEDPSHLVDRPAPPLKSKEEEDVPSPTATVAVGAARLHQVTLPSLQMTPIYWIPLHDTATTARATWFYQDVMLPVEKDVAIMLEAGYTDLRCWTDTWQDELDSAAEVGAAGEEKIVHRLWPEDPRAKFGDARPSSRQVPRDREGLLGIATSILVEETQPDTPEQLRQRAVEAACALIDIACGPDGPDNKASGHLWYGRAGAVRNYSTWGVIYANHREARLLKPSLLPSAYYGRRPLANYIRKGYKLGIPVLRGFDQAVWDKLHPTKASAKAERTTKSSRKVDNSAKTSTPSASRTPSHLGPPSEGSSLPSDFPKQVEMDSDQAKPDHPRVTELILVIHGIGQKLSERMESYHFTHAMNAFRREVNVEANSKELRSLFRKDMGNVMVLPINWRQSLSFDEGGYRDGMDGPEGNDFTMQDITPATLPSVRNIISDVLLDIPFYMSHHQPKMIAAVIKEANRVYQLWTQNNPGFPQYGRVHIIAHSLGSLMSLEILSRQPSVIPSHLSDPASHDLETEPVDHFLFNTTNLFTAGSPGGVFLLLKRAQLRPRLDHPSEAALEDPLSNDLSICGEQGQYGCLAVDNLYNILNPYDPVAYRMNPAVDAEYASFLKQAVIPSATPGWFGVGTKTSTRTTINTSPPLPRLPSNVELETHNFTREERAEARMRRLNDNGQIDFYLRYGGGAFEIPYITMLGAHSSYWLLRDFVRFIVTETGRPPGPDGTFLGMRAAKRKKAPIQAGSQAGGGRSRRA